MLRRRNVRWFHLAALTAAFVAVLLLGSGAYLWHLDRPGSEASCSICHAAHLAPLLGNTTSALAGPLVVAWNCLGDTQLTHAAPTALNAPPRAPPV